MKTITVNQIASQISAALESKKKNILFVSRILDYEPALAWFEDHPDYHVCRATPAPLYEEIDGRLVKNEDYPVIHTERLESANSDRCIWFHHAFSQDTVMNFEGFLDIIKNRYYVNRFPDEPEIRYALDKLALFMAFTATPQPDEWAALDETYYALFDEVYLVE